MNNLPFGFDRPEDSPGFLLWQTTITWQRLIKKALDQHGVTHPQFVIMALLLWLEEHDYECTQTLIAQWSKLDKMTVSKSLKQLAAAGLIERTENQADTRAKISRLTPNGRHQVSQLIPIVERIDDSFFGTLSQKQLEDLKRSLYFLVDKA